MSKPRRLSPKLGNALAGTALLIVSAFFVYLAVAGGIQVNWQLDGWVDLGRFGGPLWFWLLASFVAAAPCLVFGARLIPGVDAAFSTRGIFPLRRRQSRPEDARHRTSRDENAAGDEALDGR